MTSSSRTPGALAVIGGGAAGTLTAIAALWRTRLAVTVVEPRPRLGRGVAYSTCDPVHRLNVPAGSMSAYPDHPDHFALWAAGHDADATPFSFLPRSDYGRYLADVLRQAASDVAPGRLTHVRASALSLQRRAGAWSIGLEPAGELVADHVVLAVGQTPTAPAGVPAELLEHPAYISDPWAGDALLTLPHGPILCLGTGLTAVDVALSAAEWSRRSTVLAISRHGLRPLAHRAEGAPVWVPRLAAGHPATALGLLRAARAEVALAGTRGLDWRDVVNGLRPQVPTLWGALPERERRRLSERLGRHWEVHRHRLAPAVAARVGDLEREGRLRFAAARIEQVRPAGNLLAVELRDRRGVRQTHVVAAVVNCSGAGFDAGSNPLLAGLEAAGLCRRGPLGLGVGCDEHGSLLDAAGRPTGVLTLAALRRGDLWETTSIPEIRQQAFQLAEVLARRRRQTVTSLAG